MRQNNRYLFNGRNFWPTYGISILVTPGGILADLVGKFKNGVSLGTNFPAPVVMAATIR